MIKEYLGDSVYIQIENNQIKLTTENGLPTDPSNTIYLSFDLVDMLYKYKKRLTGES